MFRQAIQRSESISNMRVKRGLLDSTINLWGKIKRFESRQQHERRFIALSLLLLVVALTSSAVAAAQGEIERHGEHGPSGGMFAGTDVTPASGEYDFGAGNRPAAPAAGDAPANGSAAGDRAAGEQDDVELTTSQGCGGTYFVGETIVIKYRVAREAYIRLRIERPDGTSGIVAEGRVAGGAWYSASGTAALPEGTRRLSLEVNEETAAECSYIVRRTTEQPSQLTAELMVDRGCGASYSVGERIAAHFKVSRDANVQLVSRESSGEVVTLASGGARGGQWYGVNGTASLPAGRTVLELRAEGVVKTCDLIVRGESGEPRIEVSPASIDFGTVEVGARTERRLTIRNAGNANLAISSIGVLGGSSSAFSLCGSNVAPVLLGPGESRTVPVCVAAVSPGLVQDRVRFSSNDLTTSVVEVLLKALLAQDAHEETRPYHAGDDPPYSCCERDIKLKRDHRRQDFLPVVTPSLPIYRKVEDETDMTVVLTFRGVQFSCIDRLDSKCHGTFQVSVPTMHLWLGASFPTKWSMKVTKWARFNCGTGAQSGDVVVVYRAHYDGDQTAAGKGGSLVFGVTTPPMNDVIKGNINKVVIVEWQNDNGSQVLKAKYDK